MIRTRTPTPGSPCVRGAILLVLALCVAPGALAAQRRHPALPPSLSQRPLPSPSAGAGDTPADPALARTALGMVLGGVVGGVGAGVAGYVLAGGDLGMGSEHDLALGLLSAAAGYVVGAGIGATRGATAAGAGPPRAAVIAASVLSAAVAVGAWALAESRYFQDDEALVPLTVLTLGVHGATTTAVAHRLRHWSR